MTDPVTEQGREPWNARDIGDGMGAFRAFLAQEILARFPSPWLREASDAAVLELGGERWAATTDAFLVDPPFFPGGDIGRMAVCGTANDLLSVGARPQFLLMSLVVGAATDPARVRAALDGVQEQTRACGAVLVGGDTKTITGTDPEIMITMAGLGRVRRQGAPLSLRAARPGDVLLVTGPVGAHGIAVLSAREGLGFEQRVRSDCRDVGALIGDLVVTHQGLRGLRDLTRGGLLGVAHELARDAQAQITLDADAVPVAHEVAMCCEMLGISALELTNEGCLVLAVDAYAAPTVLAALHAAQLPQAARIGTVDGPHPGGLVRLRRAGRVSVLEEAPKLGVPRLC